LVGRLVKSDGRVRAAFRPFGEETKVRKEKANFQWKGDRTFLGRGGSVKGGRLGHLGLTRSVQRPRGKIGRRQPTNWGEAGKLRVERGGQLKRCRGSRISGRGRKKREVF